MPYARAAGPLSVFVAAAALCGSLPLPVLAQDRPGDDATQLEAVEVIGTRIKKTGAAGQTPVLSISRQQLEASGIGSIGDILQRLSVSSSSLNTKFNSAGNFGFPSDSGGVGSGSTTVSLRHLGAKRVLVLVDGVRWVNESSASGVSGAVDLNTIPFTAVDHIEILTDGASSLYGSDAIAGVVNIVTRKRQEQAGVRLYMGDYSTGDGATSAASLALGGGASGTDFLLGLDYYNQDPINSGAWEQSSFPVPGTGVAFGSSATPTTRSVFFDPANNTQGGLCPLVDTDGDGVDDSALCNITANGTAGAPTFTHPFPGGFHIFTGGPTGDRFNFAPFNLLLTPSERSGLFTQIRQELPWGLDGWVRGTYQSRESVNRAAPEPIFIGPDAGTGGIGDTVGVHATNPYNPFGYALDPGSNFVFAGRRPLEGGPRVFTQNVETRYLAGGVRGGFQIATQHYLWDVNLISGRNRATQTVHGTYNIAHIANALGPAFDNADNDFGADADADGNPIDQPACGTANTATTGAPPPSPTIVPNCVPLNFFGGPGTITPEMLNYIAFIENDRSRQSIDGWSANVSGGLVALPAGSLDAAFGLEHRRLAGEYSPDAVVTAGESNGVPSLPTSGAYTVDEAYVELRVPVLAGVPAVKQLDLSLATRYSDYSTFGETTNSKFGVLWQILDEVTARATFAEGFRAPSVGELFGSPARFDATITDPCNLATGQTAANCSALGVASPGTFTQANTQISIRTGGNENLEPETAESLTAGIVWSPNWAEQRGWSERMDFELTYYQHELDDAIGPLDAQTQLDRCVATLDPVFCSGIVRSGIGNISSFDNTLRNLGTIDTDGYDFGIDWIGPTLGLGRIGADWQSTYVASYDAVSKATGLAEPNDVGVEVNDSSIPRFRSSLRLTWSGAPFEAGWTLRYISKLTEQCGDAAAFPVCSDPVGGTNELDPVFYNDVRVAWKLPGGTGARVATGVNNVLDQDPPPCLSCSLNGYDASLYDLPGPFVYLEASVGF